MDAEIARGARHSILPRIEPVLPKLVKDVPRGRQWVYELKLDGFRGTLHVEAGRGYFRSKTKKPLRRFDDLANAIAKEIAVENAILDGEIVVMDEGRPQFYALMANRQPASYVAFDLLWLGDRDLRSLPLWRRKRALEKLVRGTLVGYVEPIDDPRLMDAVIRLDLECVVAKRRADPYSQQTEWLKIKHAAYSQMEGRAELFHRRRR
jgi:bifunctional non-homologous end joining protein LigD